MLVGNFLVSISSSKANLFPSPLLHLACRFDGIFFYCFYSILVCPLLQLNCWILLLSYRILLSSRSPNHSDISLDIDSILVKSTSWQLWLLVAGLECIAPDVVVSLFKALPTCHAKRGFLPISYPHLSSDLHHWPKIPNSSWDWTSMGCCYSNYACLKIDG